MLRSEFLAGVLAVITFGLYRPKLQGWHGDDWYVDGVKTGHRSSETYTRWKAVGGIKYDPAADMKAYRNKILNEGGGHFTTPPVMSPGTYRDLMAALEK